MAPARPVKARSRRPTRRTPRRRSPAAGKLFFNHDADNHYYHPLPGTVTGEHLDRVVDALRDTHVRAFVLCVNNKFAYYPSKAWEVFGDTLEPGNEAPPAGAENSGAADDPWFHRCAMNLRGLFARGIDPPGRMFARARRYGMEAWASLRMNDGHARGQPDHPLNSRFYREHPEYWTTGNTLGHAWDYALRPVRDHFMTLILEVLERYDLDGLELDWNRSPNHFRDGHFGEGRTILTRWLSEVRAAVDAAAERRGHAIKLVTRVPARPEVARGIGLDAAAWARRGLVDRLIVGPYKGTTDFDVPVEVWKRLLRGTAVPVTVSFEHVASFYPGAPNCWSPQACITNEQLRGAAVGALHRGSDGVYLFNLMARPFEDPELFRELGSPATLERKGRDYLQTWVSPEVPGKPIQHALPRAVPAGASARFGLYTGPKPARGARCTAYLTVANGRPGEFPRIALRVNGRATEQRIPGPSPVLKDDLRIPFLVDREAFAAGYTRIAVLNGTASELKITGLELAMRFPW